MERRRLLSFTAASDPPGAGGTVTLATFTGNGAGDVIIFDRVEHAAGARLRHNRVSFAGDGGFVSDLDFDSARPGEQVMLDLPANRVIVNAGGGDDTMRVGLGSAGAAPFSRVSGDVRVLRASGKRHRRRLRRQRHVGTGRHD
jgi:hypothetical protein